ncbi:MAG TPA: ABC transporter permease [Acidobacteriota bacterium]|nr:ABC transporter permease [Acidobacteriota bacterium]
MSATQVFNVARREFIAKVRNKWFVIGTLLVPFFMSMWVFIPSLLERADVDELHIAVADVGTGSGSQIAGRLAEIDDFALVAAAVSSLSEDEVTDARASLQQQIVDESLDGYLLLERDDELGIRGRYYARVTGNLVITSALERAVRRVALEDYLQGSGLRSERINALVSWNLEAITISAEGEEEGGFFRAYMSTLLLAMLLYITVLIGGQQMGNSIIEEKSTRLIELILGAVTSTEFIAGKILGVLAASLLQLSVWILLSMLVGLFVLPALAVGAAMQGTDLLEILDPSLLFYFAVLYLLGYTFYSVIYAAAASTCTSSEELQQIAFPLVMPMVLSLVFVFYAITNPATLVTRVISLFPPATPLVMLARINVLRPPTWEIWLGILLLLAATVALVWVAAKMFRFTLLMSGKRPTIGAIVRLIRAALEPPQRHLPTPAEAFAKGGSACRAIPGTMIV